MEIKHLRSFVLVSETGSFSAAADRCCLTQSAISQHIKALEEELDSVLLIRDARSVRMTESGAVLLPLAKKVLKDAQECKEQVAGVNGCLTGELHIGVGSCIEPIVRSASLKMMEMYPGVTLHVEFAKACRLNQMLREHRIDLAFTMNTAYREEGIETLPCIPFHISAIMSKTHVLARKKKVTFEDLCLHNVIMPDLDDRVQETLQHYFPEDLRRLRVKAVVSSASAALAASQSADFVTFMPRSYIDGRPLLTSRPIEGLEMEMMSNAHWMKDVPLKRSARAFLDIVQSYSIPVERMREF